MFNAFGCSWWNYFELIAYTFKNLNKIIFTLNLIRGTNTIHQNQFQLITSYAIIEWNFPSRYASFISQQWWKFANSHFITNLLVKKKIFIKTNRLKIHFRNTILRVLTWKSLMFESLSWNIDLSSSIVTDDNSRIWSMLIESTEFKFVVVVNGGLI